jgi:LAS seventeen-binding protein 5
MAGPVVQPVSKKDKKSKNKGGARVFSFEKEKPRINTVITEATIESTGLMNALRLVNRESQRVSDNTDCRRRFERCKTLRKETFRYCSLVLDESYLGTLLNSNDQLSDALILYEQLDKSFDYDSDSEDYETADAAANAARRVSASLASPTSPPPSGRMASLSISSNSPPPPTPPRPQFSPPPPAAARKGKEREIEEEAEEDDDPFADSNEIATPAVERTGMNW